MPKYCLLAAFMLGALHSLTGCFPVKGYPGPERPDSELMILSLDAEANWIAADDAYANDVAFGAGGIRLLPGSHTFSVNVDVKEPPENCVAYSTLDYSGYDECRRNYRSCDCFNYLSVYRRCDRRVKNGNCGGKVVGVAGQQYQVVLRRSQPFSVTSYVVESGTTRRAGQSSCDIYGAERIEVDEQFQGTGRSTAYANGIYGCF